MPSVPFPPHQQPRVPGGSGEPPQAVSHLKGHAVVSVRALWLQPGLGPVAFFKCRQIIVLSGWLRFLEQISHFPQPSVLCWARLNLRLGCSQGEQTSWVTCRGAERMRGCSPRAPGAPRRAEALEASSEPGMSVVLRPGELGKAPTRTGWTARGRGPEGREPCPWLWWTLLVSPWLGVALGPAGPFFFFFFFLNIAFLI